MLLPVAEKIANLAINVDSQFHEKLIKHVGKAIRIKTIEPYHVFYLLVRDHDVKVLSEYNGDEHLQVRMPFRTFLLTSLGFEKFTPYNRDIKIDGDGDLGFDLAKAFETTNLWGHVKTTLKAFIPEFSTIEDLVKLVAGQEPAWLSKLEEKFATLPETNREILSTLKRMEEQGEKKLFLSREISREVSELRKLNYCMFVVISVFAIHYFCQAYGLL